MKASIKQICFDLDTKALQKYYPKPSWENAYMNIEKFMRKHDFTRIQGSVYVSHVPKTSYDITFILNELKKQYPWLNQCMRDCRETNIAKSYNRSMMFDKTVNIPTREELEGLERDGEDSNLVGEKEELKYKMSKLSMLLGSKELER